MLNNEKVIAYLKATGMFGNIKYEKVNDLGLESRRLDTLKTDKKGYHYSLTIFHYKNTGGTYVGLSKWTPMIASMICNQIVDADSLHEIIENIKGKLVA